MINKRGQIVCDVCGKFISMKDIIDGKAAHYLSTPDAEGAKETFDSYCAKHVDRKIDFPGEDQ